MSKELDKARLQLELKRVGMGKANLEYQILEQRDAIIRAEENIKRLQDNIDIQTKAEADLEKRIAEFS